MSKVQVDKVVNLSDDGAPQLTYGAELPVGYGLTGAGGLNITGVVTAASAVFSGNVTIGGTLTYEDVTNIDALGIVTARAGVNVSGGELLVGSNIKLGNAGVVTATSFVGSGANLTGVASTDYIITGTAATFNNKVYVNSTLTASEGIDVSAGVGTFAGDVSIADKIIHTGDTNTAIRFPAADTIQFETSGTNRLRIDSSGNIGAGTLDTTIDEALSIERAGNVTVMAECSASGSGANAAFRLKSADSSSDWYMQTGNETSGGLRFYDGNNSAERARIDTSGRLIIGATSVDPLWGISAALSVEGNTGNTSAINICRNSNDGSSPYLTFGKSRGTSVGSQTIVQDGDSLGTIAFTAADGTDKAHSAAFIQSQVDGTPGGNDLPGRLLFSTTADGAASSTERMRVDSSGRVLIGSSDGATYADAAQDDLIVGSSANGKNDGITILSGTGQNGSIAFADSGGTYQGLVSYVHASDYLRFFTGGSLRLRLDSDGLKFGSDSAAANALDDYEEGDFTPTLGSGTPTSVDGKYTKVGNICVAAMSITFQTITTGDHVVLGGLPFTAAAGRPGAAILRYSDNANAYKIAWHVSAGTTTSGPYFMSGGGVVTYNNLSTSRFDLTFVYRTT